MEFLLIKSHVGIIIDVMKESVTEAYLHLWPCAHNKTNAIDTATDTERKQQILPFMSLRAVFYLAWMVGSGRVDKNRSHCQ